MTGRGRDLAEVSAERPCCESAVAVALIRSNREPEGRASTGLRFADIARSFVPLQGPRFRFVSSFLNGHLVEGECPFSAYRIEFTGFDGLQA